MEEILHQAEQSEKEYDWSRAAELYEKALNLLPQDDFSSKGETHERLAYAFYRFAFQAETNDEFRQRLNQAIRGYEKAREHYQKLGELMKTGKVLRCEAMIAYIGYWLVSDVPEKKRLIDECWRLTKEALKVFEQALDSLEYGRTFNQLSVSIDLGYYFEWDHETREKMMREAIEYGEQAVKFLLTLQNSNELARAYVKTATFLTMFGYNLSDPDRREKCNQKAMDCWLKATKLSEEEAMIELSSVLFGTGPGGYWGDGADAALSNHEKALEYSRKTRDRFIIGRALDLLAYHSYWRQSVTEDPDERTALLKKSLQCAEDAKHQYSSISFASPRGGVFWVGELYPVYYASLAFRETDIRKKRELLEKALEGAPALLKQSENSGYPDIIGYAHLAFGVLLQSMAMTEVDSQEKKRLLELALKHFKESLNITEKVEPYAYWNIGIKYGFLAGSRYLLSDLVQDPKIKKSMLQEALQDSEDALRLVVKGLTSYDKEALTPSIHTVASYEFGIGRLLIRLYEVTNDSEYLEKAMENLEKAAETFGKLNQANRLAECHWKCAQTYDSLGEYLRAAENFDIASNNYESAAEKIHQLKEFYQDHASYMRAWGRNREGKAPSYKTRVRLG